ncbi:hypothetical protein [Methylocystis sp. ATCC 49242]|uniref:hypothetical protein n=1 Tax=Methylocystis sp. ATCC 49242 TaxID=622637 RepID=UPI0001F879C9|nr:hypothetical protein [Methylocystis sp. ATCC 49242]
MTTTFDRRRFLLGAGGLALAAPAFAQPGAQESSDELQVRVENNSVPELCAEKDNIELDFISPRVRHMQIQAVHPSYINTIQSDRWAPDWSSCDLSPDPKFFSQSRRRTFWETPEFWLTGYTFPSFWRPNDVPVRVGDKVEKGLHMIQVWMWYRERAEEIMAIYPPDGYWRGRPLPFEDMRWTAYGSSFLVGPVEMQERPIVDLDELVFEPATRTFVLKFRRGGEARITVKGADQDRLTLDVSFSDAMPGGRPFAALRSMYTMETMSDAAIVGWRNKRGKGWEESPVIDFKGASATEFWVGRHLPSRHNLSAPDMVFSRFRGEAAAEK